MKVLGNTAVSCRPNPDLEVSRKTVPYGMSSGYLTDSSRSAYVGSCEPFSFRYVACLELITVRRRDDSTQLIRLMLAHKFNYQAFKLQPLFCESWVYPMRLTRYFTAFGFTESLHHHPTGEGKSKVKETASVHTKA